MDYLTHLYDRKLSWSTIGIHRSAISMTLAPNDGVRVGDHQETDEWGVQREAPSSGCSDALGSPQFSAFFNTGLSISPFPV
jgi:hypothetical protein